MTIRSMISSTDRVRTRCVMPVVGLVAALVTHDAHAQDAAPDAAAVSFAQQRFASAQQLYTEGRFPEALAEARASNAVVPSPNSRLYIARCLRELGRLAEAATEYDTVVRESEQRAHEAARYAATYDAARTELTALRARIAPAVVPPPPVVPARVATVVIAARPLVRRAPVPVPPVRIAAWITLGVGAVAAVATPVLWYATDHQWHALDDACTASGAACIDHAGAAQGRALQASTDVSFGVALAGLGTAIALFVASGSHPAPRRESLHPAVSFRGIGVGGAF